MVMKKTLLSSFVISFSLLASINLYTDGSALSSIINRASLETGNSIDGQQLMSFAFGNLVLYLVMTGVIYLFLRGIVKSFESPERN